MKKILGAFALIASTFVHASLPEDSGPISISKTIPLMDYQIYSALRSGDLEILGATDENGEEITDLHNRLLHIPEGSILEIADSSTDGSEVTLSLDLEGLIAGGEDVSGLPNLIKVRTSDFERIMPSLIPLEESDSEFGLEEFLLPEIVAGKGSKRAGMTYCLKDVRIFASGSKCRAKVVVTEKAIDAMALYLGTGDWVRIKRSSWNAYPVCTACFYGGGRQDCSKGRNGTACGHAAIKISATKWKGAGVRGVPGLPDKNGVFKGVRRKPYKFQGCIVPKRLS